MPALAHKLKLHDYFALAFGTMIGTGWLVLMDDWLGRGGPLGAILGFVLGGIILLPVGYVYGLWVRRLPDAAGEAAYTAQVFPPIVSYFTGWIMLLAYFIVCPWEAIALGKIAAYIFPAIDSLELYRVAGQPVFLPRLILGVALTLFLGLLNYRGIRLTARPDLLVIQAHNPEQEEAEEEIEVGYEGNDLEVGFNVNYLLDALAAIDGQDVELGLTDSNSSCLIRSPGNASARYVVMPMRL